MTTRHGSWRRDRWRVVLPCLVASMAVHFALFGPLLLQAPPRRHVPERTGAGASAVRAAEDEPVVMTLIYPNTTTVTSPHEQSDEQIASSGLTPSRLPILIAGPDSLPAIDASDADTKPDAPDVPESAADQSGHAVLFGRYLGQITARVERAWMRPRTPIGADRFSCSVQITQDRHGNVLQTILQRCNGDLRWQLSLVQAIQSASPLPAPPDPSVFADALVLEFDSNAYVVGGRGDGFEPLTPAVRKAMASDQNARQLKELTRALHAPSAQPRTIELHLSGSARARETLPPAEPDEPSADATDHP
jgi:hypothetical protein